MTSGVEVIVSRTPWVLGVSGVFWGSLYRGCRGFAGYRVTGVMGLLGFRQSIGSCEGAVIRLPRRTEGLP